MDDAIGAGLVGAGSAGALVLNFIVRRFLSRGVKAEDEREKDFRDALARLIGKADEMQVCQIQMKNDLAELRRRVRSFSTLRRRVDGGLKNHRRRLEALEAWKLERELTSRQTRRKTKR